MSRSFPSLLKYLHLSSSSFSGTILIFGGCSDEDSSDFHLGHLFCLPSACLGLQSHCGHALKLVLALLPHISAYRQLASFFPTTQTLQPSPCELSSVASRPIKQLQMLWDSTLYRGLFQRSTGSTNPLI